MKFNDPSLTQVSAALELFDELREKYDEETYCNIMYELEAFTNRLEAMGKEVGEGLLIAISKLIEQIKNT